MPREHKMSRKHYDLLSSSVNAMNLLPGDRMHVASMLAQALADQPSFDPGTFIEQSTRRDRKKLTKGAVVETETADPTTWNANGPFHP